MTTPDSSLSALQKAYSTIQLLRRQLNQLEQSKSEAIAIIGMGCRAPDAKNPDELWNLIRSGKDAVSEIPASRWDAKSYFDPRPGTPGKSYTMHGGFIEGVDQFDASFFQISAREAESMDPQQRLLLEVTWEALENAGIPPSTLFGSLTGVFIGVTSSDYGLLQASPQMQIEVNPYFNTGTPLNACAGRISYTLGLNGPSIALDTACSSSLSAIHQACNSLRLKDCDVAITGGVNLILSPLLNITLSSAGMMSADGRCKTFSEDANGYVRGEGCGVVILKRLSDVNLSGDRVLGIIRATGSNHDGASSGFTVPNGMAQQKLITQTLDKAKILASQIDYVEAHGTGTALGDPIEANSLGQVLGKAGGRSRALLVGSIKSNIGHLESAAGVMGLIKIIQALRHREIPPSLHLQHLSKKIAWQDLNIKPVTELTPWISDGHPRYASLSAFGASGSNAHLILEEANTSEVDYNTLEKENTFHMIGISAKNMPALKALAQSYQNQFEDSSVSFANFCKNVNQSRDHFNHRLAICSQSISEFQEKIKCFLTEEEKTNVHWSSLAKNNKLQIAFVFGGQGSIYFGMGKELYHKQSEFKKAIDHCARILEPLMDKSLLEILFLSDLGQNHDLIIKAAYAQPALLSIQYALARMWQSFGVSPIAVLGYSLGEYAAACCAGVISIEDALYLVAHRGRLTDQLEKSGQMAVIFATFNQVANMIEPYQNLVNIAAINAPSHIVISGDEASIGKICNTCKEESLETYLLPVTHAFHSSLMEPMLEEFEILAKVVTYNKPQIKFISCVSGLILSPTKTLDASYWRKHYREPVLFAKAMESFTSKNVDLFLEISPNPSLVNIGKLLADSVPWLVTMQQNKSDSVQLSNCLAELYIKGQDFHFKKIDFTAATFHIDLPHYPFQKQTYWIPNKEATQMMNTNSPSNVLTPNEIEKNILNKLVVLFAELFRVTPENVNIDIPFLEMGADSLVLLSGARVIEDNFGIKIEIRQFFEEISSIKAIAEYLSKHHKPLPVLNHPVTSVVGNSTQSIENLNPAPIGSLANQPPILPQVAVQQTPVIQTSYSNQVIPAMHLNENASLLSQIIMSQTQLMAQHITLLQGASGPSLASPQQTALNTENINLANQVSSPTRPSFSTSSSAPLANVPQQVTKNEDRSSPLRALNIPITPQKSNLSIKQEAFMSQLIDKFQSKTPKSKALAQDSRKKLADSRASIGFRFSTKEILYPISGIESTGSHMKDVDENDYVDLTMGFGVLLFGSKPAFLEGVLEKEIENGYMLGPRSMHMGEISRLFTELTGHERVGFTNSGTEAVMIAMRLARAATKRDKIVIFEGAYNGHADGTLAKTTRLNNEFISEPVAPGVPNSVAKDILVLDYGTAESLNIIRQHAHELAAVLVEPVQSRRLDLQPFEFLHELRTLTKEHDVALIFDEMVSGFRAHPGGVQGLIGLKADIATYGKIIGGGLPIGAVAGSARFLDGIDGGMWQYGDSSYPTATRTYFGGTFCQHPFSMANCLATLRYLKSAGPGLQESLNLKTAELAKTLNHFFESEMIPMKVVHFASTFGFKFSGNLEMFYYLLLEKGIYIWEWRACFLSTAHTDEDIAKIIKAVKESIYELREGGFISAVPNSVENLIAINQAKDPSTNPANSQVAKEEPSERAWFRQQSKLSHNEIIDINKNVNQESLQKQLEFSFFYFGNYHPSESDDKYELLIDSAKYADVNGFSSIWIPERHFDEFGGFSPNPSVLAAAIARETQHVRINAGSVVAPLHDAIRITEEWSLVDNLSNGRVGVSFASGWHPNDFVFSPDAFSNNRNLTFETIETVQHLWSGQSINRKGGKNIDVELKTFPRPLQKRIPIWFTVVNNPDSYRKAGEMGLKILTNLMGQSLGDLANNIAIYKKAFVDHGGDIQQAHVTVLIHTFLDKDASVAIEEARKPMCDYLLSSIQLFQRMAEGLGPVQDVQRASDSDKEFIVNKAYERYVSNSALIGSPETVMPIVNHLINLGVNELACFIDFGVKNSKVIQSLPFITTLKKKYDEMFQLKDSATNKLVTTFPLSEAQKQLWLLTQLNPEGGLAYNDPAAISMKGPLQIDFLSKAIDGLIHEHQSLRTTIEKDGELQVVAPASIFNLPFVDLSAQENPEVELKNWFEKQNKTAFDLHQGPLFIPTLLKISAEHHVLALSAHHIISDGPSMGYALHEIIKNYAAYVSGQSPVVLQKLQYQDFVLWQQEQAHSEKIKQSENYWLKQFATPIPNLELPLDYARPQVKSYRGARVRTQINTELLSALREQASKNGCTIYMVLMACYSIMLHRLTSQNKIVIGAPFSGRSISGSQELIGYCVHLLPILSQIDRMSTIEGHLKSTRVTLLEAYQNQDYPFARLINRLNIERDVSRAPLVNTVFNLERIEDTQHIADLNVDMQTQPVSFSRMDLTLTANLRSNEINLECDFNTDLFEQKTIEQFLNVYLNILGQFVKNPQQKIATLPLLCAEDEARQLVSKSELVTPHKLPSFIELFEEHAVLRSDSIALIDETSQQVFTYQHLNQLSNQLARQLIACGAQIDLRIGVCLDRSWQMLVSLLAILKSGSAYVPLDPNYPEQRLSYILKDSGIKILITQQNFLDKLKGLQNHTICFDHEMTTFQTLPKYNLALKNLPLQLAYVIYTSGSSGQPKGVMITHEGFSNYLTWAIKSYNADQFDGSPTLGSFSFDATITSIFVPLAAGNKVILLPTGDELAPLMSLVNTPWHFSFIKITPAHLEILNTLVSADNQAQNPICHKWVLGGEALKPSVANPWLINQQAYIVNEYGPTETVVGCCVFETNKQVDTIFPIGFAIDNIQLFVLDENLELLPPGIPGELYISGLGLARGYLEKATLTASAFIPNQFSHLSPKLGSRLYKTGDRVKFLPNGQLHFLGRKDQQIKLHGYRIELEEIEHALTQISGIREAIALVREVQKDSKLLVAYITSHENLSLNSSNIRSELKKSLPEYMVPTLIITLQSMPLTSHGKIDRQLLPMPVMTDDSAKELVASFNSVENLILDTWRSVLNLEHIQINDNFFDIGGNSLLLLQVFKRLQPQLKTPCEVIDLFKFPTIKQFSTFLSQETTSVKNDQKLIATRSLKQTKALLEKAKKQKSLRAQPIH